MGEAVEPEPAALVVHGAEGAGGDAVGAGLVVDAVVRVGEVAVRLGAGEGGALLARLAVAVAVAAVDLKNWE